MSVATKAPAAPKATKAPVTKATKAPALTADEMAVATAALRRQWELAEAGETKAADLFTAAGIAWENSRVIKVRVAFAAATIKRNGSDANLLNACRILFTDPAASAAKRTAEAEKKKSTLRNYVDAGTALDNPDVNLAFATGEPTEQERKIVAAVFRDGNRRDKSEAKAAKGEGEGNTGKGEGEGEGEQDAEAVSFVHLVAYVAKMNAALDMIVAGSVVVSEREASSMADMLNGFQMKLAAYSEGK